MNNKILISRGQKNVKLMHYNSIDGLRSISCLGIIIMHIQANTEYKLTGFLFDKFIPSLTWLVYLFLMISGFGMCVGYLNIFQKGSVNFESFYKKRYLKILPFFSFLLMIALVMEHNLSAVYEASIEILLLHGLLPNNAVSVIGVCWTLGVIFLFYLLFPAFSVLMRSKKCAWLSLIISLWVVLVCDQYFFSDYFVTDSFAPRHNFLFCLPMFIGGGIVYLYRNHIREICKNYRWCVLFGCIVASVCWYFIPNNTDMLFYISSLVLFLLWLSYAVGVDSKLLSSKPLKYLSGISMEMYLAQMVVFRAVEKLNLLYLCGNSGLGGWISFFISWLFTVIGLILFINVYKIAVKFVVEYCIKRRFV